MSVEDYALMVKLNAAFYNLEKEFLPNSPREPREVSEILFFMMHGCFGEMLNEL
jgi:hypothetical protein